MRGNHRQRIFYSSRDREVLDDIVRETLERTAATVHAYCWMTNHIHLIVRVAAIPLGVTMQRICSKFARRIQVGLSTTGHLFERRYFARLVNVDSYLLQAIRYVHLNPVLAGLASSPDHYPWSSHADYLGQRSRPWVTTFFALGMLHPHPARARALYQAFVQEGVGRMELGTSMPEWGAPESIEQHDLAREERSPPPTPPQGISLAQITSSVCSERGVTSEELACSSAARRFAAARAEVARRAVELRVASLIEVAKLFNRSVATLSRGVERLRRAEQAAGRT
jgi:REP-associated tyrosine transposase